MGKDIFKNFNEAIFAKERGDQQKAFSMLKSLVENFKDQVEFSIIHDARYNLGVMYLEGEGTAQNYKEAFKWFSKSARRKHAGAQYNLALMYKKGLGVPQNYIYSYMWFSLAKTNGDKEAQEAIEALTKEMFPEDIRKADELVKRCVDSKYKDCPE